MTPEFVLVLVLLNVESSYQQNVERPRGAVPDTVQFWFAPAADWRVKTFAIDHDIHVHQIRSEPNARTFGPDDAIASTRKNYDDVIEKIVIVKFSDPTKQAEVAAVLRASNLGGTLELGKAGVAFYNPDDGHYRTQSTPN